MKRTLMQFSGLLILSVCFLPSLSAAESVLHPVDLRCEYLKNPLGIDSTQPRLSWKLQAVPSARRGLMQSAYQIQVASSEVSLASGNPEFWDSGKVDNDRDNLISYAGKPLQSRQVCWWRVRSWDQQGAPSQWSEPALWTMGLLAAGDWNARWIGINGGDETLPGDPHTRLPARMLRREFDASKQIRRATIYASGLGFFDLYLNGSRTISAPPMNPNPKITVCLNCGHSEFSVPATWLASGWLRPLPAPVYHSFDANGRDDMHVA